MVREDIVAGLKNAMARGQSLEQAVQSFIRAGYNDLEVREAAKSLSFGASSIVAGNAQGGQSLPVPQGQVQPSQQVQQAQQVVSQSIAPKKLSEIRPIPQVGAKPKRVNMTLIVILIIILLLLVGALVFMIFWGPDFLESILSKSPLG
jgi:hypothetical protein